MARKSSKGYHYKHSEAQMRGLIKFNEMDPERHRELSAKGGRAVQKMYRERETFQKTTEWLLSQAAFNTSNETVEALKKEFPDLSNQEAMAVAVIAETIRTGDSKGFVAIRDTVGESPAQNVNLQNQEPLTINIKTVD